MEAQNLLRSLLFTLLSLIVVAKENYSEFIDRSDLTADQGNWTVENCIIVKMAAQLTLYPDKASPNTTIKFDVPVTAEVSAESSCLPSQNLQPAQSNNSSQHITIQWKESNPDAESDKKDLDRNLTLTFSLNQTNSVYGVSKISAVYEHRTYKVSKNTTDPVSGSVTTVNVTVVEYISMSTFEMRPWEFLVPENRSYLCMNIGSKSLESELHHTDESGGSPGEKLTNATLSATKVQFDAFRPSSAPANQFQLPSDCSYRPNDIVPIIVGCALAGMVLMVLVAYMVGRSRSRARGYISV